MLVQNFNTSRCFLNWKKKDFFFKKSLNLEMTPKKNYTKSCLFLQEDAHCGDVKCHGESDYFLPEYIINIFVLNSVDFIYLLLSTVKLSSILLYFTILTLQLLGILFKKHLFPSALGVVGSEAILFGKRWAYHLMKRKKSACNRTKA